MQYLISMGEYFGVEADVWTEEHSSDREALLHIMGDDEELTSLSTEELIQIWNDGNGDGQSYWTIKNNTTGQTLIK